MCGRSRPFNSTNVHERGIVVVRERRIELCVHQSVERPRGGSGHEAGPDDSI